MAARRDATARQQADDAPGNPNGFGLRPSARPSSGAPSRSTLPRESPEQWRNRDPRLRSVRHGSEYPAAGAASRPGGIAWWLWVLLLGSLVFLGVVRVYVHRESAKLTEPLDMIPFLETSGPTTEVRAGALDLAWGEVPGATSYRLSVSSITGQIVVEALPVDGTEWIPPEAALPALVRGEYRWTVEAVDEAGRVLAKSSERTFRVM